MIRKGNTFITRVFTVLALLVVLLAVFPEKSKAASSQVYLGNEALINDNTWHSWNQSNAAISGWTSGRYKLSQDSNNLYLDGLEFSSSDEGVYGIYSRCSLSIIATGTNNINTKRPGIYIYDTDHFGDVSLYGESSRDEINVTSNVEAVRAGNGTISSVKFNGKSTGDSSAVFFVDDLYVINNGIIEAPDLIADSFRVSEGTIRASEYLLANDNTKTSVIDGGLITADRYMTFQGLLEMKGGSLSTGSINCFNGISQTGGLLTITADSIVVSSGNYSGSGGSVTSKKAIHIMDGDMLLSGAAVRASYGAVNVSGDLKISGGSITSDRGGIIVGRDLRISNTGTMQTDLYENDDPGVLFSSAALFIEGKLVSDGGEINAISHRTSNALQVGGETDINGGKITAGMDYSDYYGCVAQFSEPVYLQGGRFTVDTNSCSYGMYSGSFVQVNNNAVLEVNTERGKGLYIPNSSFTLNSGTVTLNSAKEQALSANSIIMKDGVLTLNSGSGQKLLDVTDSLSLANDIWISEPADGTINDKVIRDADGLIASHAVLRKVDSISVKTNPNNDLYWGDSIDPAGLVINVKFAGGSNAPLSYDTHSDMFSFDPPLGSASDCGTHSIEATCLTKKTTFNIEIKDLGTATLSGTADHASHSLQWTEAEGATFYDLYGRKKGAGNFVIVGWCYCSDFKKTGLSPGETWEYYVVPVREGTNGAVSCGSESNHVFLTTTIDPPQVSVSDNNYDSVSLEWNSVEGAEVYDIYRSSDGEYFVKLEAVADTGYTDTGLVTGTEYTYYVKAAIPDENIYSNPGNQVKATPVFTGETTLTLTNADKYEFTWTTADGATGYEVYRGNGEDGSRTLLVETIAGETSFTDDSADIYKEYNYSVVPIRVTDAGTFRGIESNVVVTEASERPEPAPPGKEEPAGTDFNLLQARSGKMTRTSIQIKWKKVSGAKKYIVYGNKCGKKNKYKKLTATKNTALTFKRVAGKRVKKGTYYKFIVYAVDNKGNVISASKTVHVATKGGKYGNDKGVRTAAKNNRVTLKKGNSFRLKAKPVPESKKLKVSRHRKIAYEASNKKVAKVSPRGVIKAVGKGNCWVYAYTQNGVCAKIKVTVK